MVSKTRDAKREIGNATFYRLRNKTEWFGRSFEAYFAEKIGESFEID